MKAGHLWRYGQRTGGLHLRKKVLGSFLAHASIRVFVPSHDFTQQRSKRFRNVLLGTGCQKVYRKQSPRVRASQSLLLQRGSGGHVQKVKHLRSSFFQVHFLHVQSYSNAVRQQRHPLNMKMRPIAQDIRHNSSLSNPGVGEDKGHVAIVPLLKHPSPQMFLHGAQHALQLLWNLNPKSGADAQFLGGLLATPRQREYGHVRSAVQEPSQVGLPRRTRARTWG